MQTASGPALLAQPASRAADAGFFFSPQGLLPLPRAWLSLLPSAPFPGPRIASSCQPLMNLLRSFQCPPRLTVILDAMTSNRGSQLGSWSMKTPGLFLANTLPTSIWMGVDGGAI